MCLVVSACACGVSRAALEREIQKSSSKEASGNGLNQQGERKMSLVESSPMSRGQYSPSRNQQVPGSPLSPFFLTAAGRGRRNGIVSPSSGSPLAQVPDGGSPLLRHLLAGRKRKRDDDCSPSPSPSSERSRRHSPRVPNSIIILRRTAAQPTTTSKTKEDQVVPSPSQPPKKEGSEKEEESRKAAESLRTLPEVSDNTKLLDLFGETAEIFANSREE